MGGELALEPRVYWCAGLRVHRSLRIIGVAGRTVLHRQVPQPFFLLQGKGATVSLEGLALEGGGLDASGVKAVGLGQLRLKAMRVRGCGRVPSGPLPSDRMGATIDGIYAKDVDRAVVQGCVLSENARDGFIGIPVRDLAFQQNLCEGNGRMGATSDVDPEKKVDGPMKVLYLDNQVRDCGTGGLHVESRPGLPPVEARFEGNLVMDCGSRDRGYSWGIVLGDHARGLLKGNRVIRTAMGSKIHGYGSGILVGRLGGPARLESNWVEESRGSGVTLNACTFPVVLEGNVIRNAGQHGLSAYQVPGLKLRRNRVEDAGGSGIWLRLCRDAVLIGNRISRKTPARERKAAAIQAELCQGLKLKNNDLGQGVGLQLDAASRSTNE